jgi:hypothetical protein
MDWDCQDLDFFSAEIHYDSITDAVELPDCQKAVDRITIPVEKPTLIEYSPSSNFDTRLSDRYEAYYVNSETISCPTN